MDILDVIGNFGRFQTEVLVLCSLRSLFLPTVFYFVQLTSSNVGHWCSPVTSYQNLSVQEWKNCCVPKSNRGFNQCYRYEVNDNYIVINDTVVKCQEWEYEKERRVSLKAEWDLVCDRKWLLSQLYFVFFLGNLISYPITGYCADKFGRKPAILTGTIGLTATTIGFSLSNSFTVLLAFRFLTGLAYTFVQVTTITLFLEVSGREKRGLAPLFTGCLWAAVTCLMIFISMYLANWRYVSLFGCFALPYTILIWRVCPESPRWLVACKKWKRVRTVLALASRKNGVKLHDVESVLKSLEEKQETMQGSKERTNLKDLLRYKKLFLLYTVLLFTFLTSRLISNGFMVSLQALGGNFEVVFLITSGTACIASFMTSVFQSLFTRRRLSLLFGFLLAGALFLLSTTFEEDLLWLRIIVAVLGRFLNTIVMLTLILFVAEVMPTRIRSVGSNLCEMAGRVGALFSSFCELLSQGYGKNASLLLFGVMALLAAAGLFFVPEVENRNLPDSLQEASRNLEGSKSCRKKTLAPEITLTEQR